jgi:hypothetical protein
VEGGEFHFMIIKAFEEFKSFLYVAAKNFYIQDRIKGTVKKNMKQNAHRSSRKGTVQRDELG